ncbi:Uu.00g094210.m01.CDS01 [Anthostomella pinea]|uniref:Uu.00g094210.m01.CDS01 n=1 Tax=Anthostomella pinea TaxID=933095 RepID=A0AAI8YKM1_9PEZI|nr:Uu.00g094210.m01.CDS01 [Anthostomella pinea]
MPSSHLREIQLKLSAALGPQLNFTHRFTSPEWWLVRILPHTADLGPNIQAFEEGLTGPSLSIPVKMEDR